MSVTQYQGFDIQLQKTAVYLVDDSSHLITHRFDDSTKQFLPITLNYVPQNFQPVITDQMIDDVNAKLVETGLFKPPTQYIKFGDEVYTPITINLATQLAENTFLKISATLKKLPRQHLRKFFDENMNSQTNSKDVENALWMGLVDLFNSENSKECYSLSVSPWELERIKNINLYTDQNESNLFATTEQLDRITEPLQDTPRAKLERRYLRLTKFSDDGLEARRQFIIKSLLDQNALEETENIILAFELAEQTGLDTAIKNPITTEVTLPNGEKLQPTITNENLESGNYFSLN